MYLNDVATIPANLAGIPGMSLPSGLAEEDGLPAGLQVLAPAMADDRLYGVGAALEALLAVAGAGRCSTGPPALAGDATGTTTEAAGDDDPGTAETTLPFEEASRPSTR